MWKVGWFIHQYGRRPKVEETSGELCYLWVAPLNVCLKCSYNQQNDNGEQEFPQRALVVLCSAFPISEAVGRSGRLLVVLLSLRMP